MAEMNEHERAALETLARAQLKVSHVLSVVGITEFGITRLVSIAQRKLPRLLRKYLTTDNIRDSFEAARRRAEEAGDEEAAEALGVLKEAPFPEGELHKADVDEAVSNGLESLATRVRHTSRAAGLTFAHAALDDTVTQLLAITRSAYRAGWESALRKRGRLKPSEPTSTLDGLIDAALSDADDLPRRVRLLLDVCGVTINQVADGRSDSWLSAVHRLRNDAVHGSPIKASELGMDDLGILTLLPLRLAYVVLIRIGVDPADRIAETTQFLKLALADEEGNDDTQYDEESVAVVNALRPLMPYLSQED